MLGIKITTDNTMTIQDFDGLDDLQDAVGGYIEMVRINEGTNLIVNEEGLMKDLPRNPTAESLCRESSCWTSNISILLGDVVVVGRALDGVLQDVGGSTYMDAFISLKSELMPPEGRRDPHLKNAKEDE
tara:strand:+ start:960 stop:1346 length:387 start_codon:yes stop_codon:yes gene_type:complete